MCPGTLGVGGVGQWHHCLNGAIFDRAAASNAASDSVGVTGPQKKKAQFAMLETEE